MEKTITHRGFIIWAELREIEENGQKLFRAEVFINDNRGNTRHAFDSQPPGIAPIEVIEHGLTKGIWWVNTELGPEKE